MKLAALHTVTLSLAFAQVAVGEVWAESNSEPAQVKPSGFVYKANPRRTLSVYYPDGWQATDKRPALVIFRCRIPEQREHFRQLGMVIVKPQLAGVNSGKLSRMTLGEIASAPRPRNQVEDAKSAIRWLRTNADKLGIDPQRIVATGTSGGGDLALQSYLNKSFQDPQDDPSVSNRPNALVLYCPAFDGINIWFVRTDDLLKATKADAPSFVALLPKFVKDATSEYATPLDHRARMIELAEELGARNGIDESEVSRFQEILKSFNERDWQLLHPVEDALKMSASRILTKEPLPPTLILLGDRDHLYEHQQAFVKTARSLGQRFTLQIYKGGGHSFMMQPAFSMPSTRDVEMFLRSIQLIDR